MMKIKTMFIPLFVLGVLCFSNISAAAVSGPVIIDHNDTDISQLSSSCVETIKSNYNLFYGHTSHGSQIVSGMKTLMDQNSLYSYNTANGLVINETSDDLGGTGDTSWAEVTRTELDSDPDTNIVTWSWCGGVSGNTAEGINTYLNTMNQLELDYPNVIFVYMTGHLDGSGEDGNLNQMNNLIRNYAAANNKVLFDFADIESFDPDGSYFLNLGADDNNDYDGGNWAAEWCSAHPGDPLCASVSCAHSQSLNCNLKGRAFWNMMAEIEGCRETGEATGAFPDVYSSHPNFDAINYVEAEGIVEGYEDGTYKPDNTINRAEFTKILIESKYEDTQIDNCAFNEQFPDVALTAWYAKYVCMARNEGIVDGYADGTFKPGSLINFAEASKIIVNTYEYPTGTSEIWYRPFVEVLQDKKAIPTSIASVNEDITRGEMAEMIYRLMENITNKASANL
ncbi:S-layer homology domain-containing protein [Candidatus Peregrinibacteria bacterium]|nr:S-layer homology domain-containing protein [Candidatus Peregrinibacteria bacterium]